MFPCSCQASMWIPPLITFVLVRSLVIIEHFIYLYIYFLSRMQCVKGGKNSSWNLTGKWSGQSHAILDTRVPRAQFLDTVERELHGKIATVFKDYYWGRERRVKKPIFLNIFHQMSEISTMPCACTQLFQGYTLLPVQLYVSLAQIFFPLTSIAL